MMMIVIGIRIVMNATRNELMVNNASTVYSNGD